MNEQLESVTRVGGGYAKAGDDVVVVLMDGIWPLSETEFNVNSSDAVGPVCAGLSTSVVRWETLYQEPSCHHIMGINVWFLGYGWLQRPVASHWHRSIAILLMTKLRVSGVGVKDVFILMQRLIDWYVLLSVHYVVQKKRERDTIWCDVYFGYRAKSPMQPLKKYFSEYNNFYSKDYFKREFHGRKIIIDTVKR